MTMQKSSKIWFDFISDIHTLEVIRYIEAQNPHAPLVNLSKNLGIDSIILVDILDRLMDEDIIRSSDDKFTLTDYGKFFVEQLDRMKAK